MSRPGRWVVRPWPLREKVEPALADRYHASTYRGASWGRPRNKGGVMQQPQAGAARAPSVVEREPEAGTDRVEVAATLERARAALLARQDKAGWWQGEDEANQTLDAQYIFLM